MSDVARRLASPSQTIGPFFHDAVALTGSNVVAGEEADGVRIRITGRVLDGEGEGIDDALVEIWQADARGVYPHPADPYAARADATVLGFGRSETDANGRFTFETVKPGIATEAAGSTVPFIDVRVFARGLLRSLVTRLYFDDEANDADPLLAALDPDRRGTLIARRDDSAGPITYHFDVKLQGDGETVFFDL